MTGGLRRNAPQRALLVLALLTSAAGIAIALAGRVPLATEAWGFRGFSALFALCFGSVGYLVATKRRENPIGWMLLAIAALSGLQTFAAEYSTYDAFGPTRLPGASFVGWLDWVWTISAGLSMGPILMLFPDGRPVTPRWRPALWLAIATTTTTAIVDSLLIVRISATNLPNQLRLAVDESWAQLVGLFIGAQFVIVLFSIASLVVRYRRARELERHQLKWLAAAGFLLAVAFLTQVFWEASKWSQLLVIATLSLIPVAIGVAILRYRLYEIDTIINRAIVYAGLTAVLGGTFVAGQALIQRAVAATTGINSDLATIVLVFVVAGIFTPLRARLQSAVDQRFKPHQPATAPTEGGAAERLRSLAQLRAEGLITDAEFEAKRQELIAQL